MGRGAVPSLVDGLEDKGDYDFRLTVISVLGAIGPEANEAVPALSELAAGRFPTIRQAVRTALEKITRKDGK